MAQLGKNLGHFISYHEDLPRVLMRSALTVTARLQAPWHLARRCAMLWWGRGEGGGLGSVQGWFHTVSSSPAEPREV